MVFEEVEHAADRALRVQGADLACLFESAAQAMSTFEDSECEREGRAEREIELEAYDRETLLVNWLNEILFLEQTNGEIYERFQIVRITDTCLRARLNGRRSRNMSSPVKAATFHQLEIKESPTGLQATIVFDV